MAIDIYNNNHTHVLLVFNMDQGHFDTVRPIVISAVIITNIVLNSTVIAVIAKYPQLREDRTTLFMFSLSLSDLACGCTAMPISAAVCSKATPQVRDMLRYLPIIHAMFSNWFAFVSMHSLCWVTVCKMVATTKPLRYEQLLSRNRCYVIIAFIWFIGALLSAILCHPANSWDPTTCFYHGPDSSLNSIVSAIMLVMVLIVWIIPVCGLLYCNAILFKAVIRANTQITAQINSIGGRVGAVENNQYVTLHTIRSAKQIFIICFVVLLLTIPAGVVVSMIVTGRETDIPGWAKFTGMWIFMFNYSANSLLYLTLFGSVRKKTRQMCSEFGQTLWNLLANKM